MKNQPFISFLKLFREDAVFDSAGRLFHILAPRKEKHFCPLADLFFGNLKSVSVFRRLREEHAEFFVKRLHRYCGAKSLSDLKTIVYEWPEWPDFRIYCLGMAGFSISQTVNLYFVPIMDELASNLKVWIFPNICHFSRILAS